MEGFIMFQHQITEENLKTFRRHVKSPMDCVINALQIIGVLDNFSSNLIRLTCVGQQGITQEQIQNIFTLYSVIQETPYEFLFMEARGFNQAKVFEDVIIAGLQPQNILFCGYEKNGFKHVFLLGRYLDGRIMYIDPQVGKNGTVCDIHQAECYKYISGAQKYYILHYNPTKKLTKKRIKEMNIDISTK